MKTPFNISTEINVRFSDTDAMGHVNNARFFSYMEQGRVAYIQKLMPEVSLNDSTKAFPFILADIQCAFLSPAFCGETLIVSLGVTHIGTKSFAFEYLIQDKASGRDVAKGKSVQVMYDYNADATFVMPQELKDQVAALEGCSFES